MADLLNTISECLTAAPRQSARDLVKSLARRGILTDKAAVNSQLYRHRDRLFVHDESQPPLWRCLATSAPQGRPQTPAPSVPYDVSEIGPVSGEDVLLSPDDLQRHWVWGAIQDVLSRILPRALRGRARCPTGLPTVALYAWQRQALDAWQQQAHRGVVEAVTGTGKTRVGMVAIRDALALGGHAHVLVPTVDLQEQWHRELERIFPSRTIGKRGNQHRAMFPDHEIIVSVVNSARDYVIDDLPPHSILVADECHRYGAKGNSRALQEGFSRRLGLTATFTRDDQGCESYLTPYFGETCFQMGYKMAIEDEVTSHFRVALVGVDFASVGEREKYEAAVRESSSARRWLTSRNWVPEEPFGEFMKHVSALGKNESLRTGKGDAYTAVKKAREYMKAFSTRRRLLANTTSKQNALEGLLAAIRAASRTIVFTETIDTAIASAILLRQHGIQAAAIHSKMKKPERKAILRRFDSGNLAAIAAPKVLDEGIDVPEADLAIIFATSKTRRQMVQRMGRVLRRKQDGRLARFIILYVEGTTEDPASGAHESFIKEITEVADEVRTFDSRTDSDEIIEYVNDFEVAEGQPPPRMAGA